MNEAAKSQSDVGHPAVDVGTRTAATLAAVEIGLGSVLHGLRLPFSGFVLSLNQGFFLARVAFTTARDPSAKSLPATVSSLVALLKALSPAGKRLTPMLGISAQGLLFNFGTLVAGRTVFGIALGAVLAALWGFVQPLIIYWAIFGTRMLRVAEELAKDVAKVVPLEPRHLVWAAAGVVALKVLLALVTVALAKWASPEAVLRYEARLVKAGRARRNRLVPALEEGAEKAREGTAFVRAGPAARGALRDLTTPLYVVSLGIGLGFLLFIDSDAVGAIWMGARFLAIGFLVFFLVRVLPVERLAARLETTPALAGWARRLRGTIVLLKEM